MGARLPRPRALVKLSQKKSGDKRGFGRLKGGRSAERRASFFRTHGASCPGGNRKRDPALRGHVEGKTVFNNNNNKQGKEKT